MKRAAIAAVALVAGCAMLGLVDNGTHLASALEEGARQLRASPANEWVVRYRPLGEMPETYEVTFSHSRRAVQTDFFGNVQQPGGGYLVVTGQHRGGTNHHERFVFTPQDLHITKTNAPTEVILRKSGDRIDVVGLR